MTQVEQRMPEQPFFSVCIPHHNRTGLLIDAMRVLEAQTFKSVEVCISDDCSTDGRQSDLLQYLASSTLAYCYQTTATNLRYDANTRNAISMARGRFVVLFGNDDCLTHADTLEKLHAMLVAEKDAGVLIGNFEDWRSGELAHRIQRSAIYPGTPYVAATHFRNMAFVSGLVVHREAALQHASAKWDGAEMYQMYVLCRIIASGMKLIETTDSISRKDMASSTDFVDSYAKRERLDPCPVIDRIMPFVHIGRLVADSIAVYQKPERIRHERLAIFRQLYRFTYPFWIIEYRRVQSWNYALGIVLGIRPRHVVGTVDVGWWGRLGLTLLWASVSLIGLLMPLKLFDGLRGLFYRLSRW
ncbi:MAG: glycosyltransferase family A protein [Pseudomonadota bacterium]